MNEEMRRFMDGDYDDGMLDLSITCVHCGNEFEIEVETVSKLISKPLKDKIKYNAQQLNYIKRTSKAVLNL